MRAEEPETEIPANQSLVGTRLTLRRLLDRVRVAVTEVPMRFGKRCGFAGIALSVLMLIGGGSLLSACNTVAGAGQDVSTVGKTVTSGAEQTKRATGIP
jgi:predicted small secreted protein